MVTISTDQTLRDLKFIQSHSHLLSESELRQVAQAASTLSEIERCRESLHCFTKAAWHIVEPDEEFRDGWHIQMLCEHLEAFRRGEIMKLLVNIPPGCMKSLLFNVFFPAWVWTSEPSARFLHATYSGQLSIRDSLKCRDIVNSKWYRSRWGTLLRHDQNAKSRFETVAKGWRFATSVGGPGTGEHPDFAIIDDPHSAEEAASELERQRGVNWFGRTIATRGKSRGVRQAVIMQRLHDKDLSGELLHKGGWVHVCLPMRFEGPHRMTPTGVGFNGGADPRTEIGELLCPALFDEEAVSDLERDLGPADTAGQLQQRPPEHYFGSEWPSSYFGASIWTDEWPAPENTRLKVIALDPSLGATEKADYAAFVQLALGLDGRMFVEAHLDRMDTDHIAKTAVRLAHQFKPEAFGLEDSGFQLLLKNPIDQESERAGFKLPLYMVSHGGIPKVTRIRRLTPYLARGDFVFRDTPGTRLLVDQLRAFPGGTHDDGPDALEIALRLVSHLF